MITGKLNALFLFCILNSLLSLKLARGEYRVYQYLVFDQPSLSIEPRIILSTLPPQSLNSYYGGSPFLQKRILRTWMCPNHTGAGKDYCSSPYLGDPNVNNDLTTKVNP
jgi:hypothetical protein